jgi:hypothetical protein
MLWADMAGDGNKISHTSLRFNMKYRETNKGKLQWINVGPKPNRPVSINAMQYELIDAK